MLAEAIEIIRALHTGELVDHPGSTSRSTPHASGTCPSSRWRSASRSRASGPSRRSHRWPTTWSPSSRIPTWCTTWNATKGAPRIGERARAVGQIPICWDPDEDAAVQRAHEQFRWFAGGWSVNADLPTTAGFAAATQFVRPEDVAGNIPCGPDLDAIVEAVRPFWEAGFTDVALVQIGGEHQEQFLAEAATPLLEKLRDAAP